MFIEMHPAPPVDLNLQQLSVEDIMHEKNLLFVDFETFFDSKQKYSLRDMSLIEYIRDSRFHAFGFAAGRETGAIEWFTSTAAFVNWSEVDVVSHNSKFDGFILRNIYGIQPRSWIDTLGMARAVIGNRVKDYNLRTLAEYYGLTAKGTLKADGVRNLSSEHEAELAEYCKHDVWLCREIFNRLTKEFPENQYKFLDWSIRAFVEPKLVLDVPLLEKTADEEKKRRERIFEELHIDRAEFSSNSKFALLLAREGYEVPTKKSVATGKTIPALSLGDVEFADLLNTDDERLKALCEARVAAKSNLLETRTAKLAAIGKTGPWSFDIGFSGAVQTHRFSGGSGAGGNPQNFPRGSAIREAIGAPEGYKLIVSDFASIEMRIVAYLARETGLTNMIEKDGDVYSDFASAYYGRVITKKDEKERRFGKTAILGLGYGMGAKKFARTVRLSTGDIISSEGAEKAVRLYRARYWHVPQLWDQLDRVIPHMADSRAGTEIRMSSVPVFFSFETITLPSGLKLQYPNLHKEGKEWVYETWQKKSSPTPTKLYGGKILENIVQALAGELLKETIVDFLPICTGLVHDEVHLLVRNEDVTETKAALFAAMTTSPKWLPDLKLDAEIGVGENWSVCK